LMLFFAICVGTAFVLRKPLWEKLLMIASALPIAIVSNVARVSLTGILQDLVSPAAGQVVHHNGWFMMIMAMLLRWGEMGLVAKLLQEPSPEGPLALGGGSSPAAMIRGLSAGGIRGAPTPQDHPRHPADKRPRP
jgi:exosortase/archaeosortase family protein